MSNNGNSKEWRKPDLRKWLTNYVHNKTGRPPKFVNELQRIPYKILVNLNIDAINHNRGSVKEALEMWHTQSKKLRELMNYFDVKTEEQFEELCKEYIPYQGDPIKKRVGMGNEFLEELRNSELISDEEYSELASKIVPILAKKNGRKE